MIYKKIIFLFLLINITLFTFAECLVLSNGYVYKGKLFSINKSNIILKDDNKLLKFSYNLIDYLIHNNSQEKDLILTIEKNSGIKEKINLIKLTKIALFYKNLKTNQINIIYSNEIKNIKLEVLPDIKNNTIENYKLINPVNDINLDIDYLIQEIIKNNKTYKNFTKEKNSENDEVFTYIFLNYNELDFYEKFWRKINGYLNDDTKNLLWNLYELYSNKEKYLNILNNNSNENNKITTEINEFNNKIIKLRKEFYYRAKKIIYNTEILINCKMN